MERYRIALNEELKILEEDGKLPHGYELAFIHGYQIAAYHWHNQGLAEGWNDHIKKLNQLLKPIPLEDKPRTKNS